MVPPLTLRPPDRHGAGSRAGGVQGGVGKMPAAGAGRLNQRVTKRYEHRAPGLCQSIGLLGFQNYTMIHLSRHRMMTAGRRPARG